MAKSRKKVNQGAMLVKIHGKGHGALTKKGHSIGKKRHAK